MNWTIADQAMVSGVNFFTGILIARYLGIEEFGIFTLAWSCVLFISGFQMATIVAPMMTIGPKQLNSQKNKYYGAVVSQQAIFSVFVFVFILLATSIIDFVVPHWKVMKISISLASAAVSYQMQDFIRRYFFTMLKPHLAFVNDFISYVGQLIVLVWCFKFFKMDSNRTLWVFALTSGIAVIFGGGGLTRLVFRRDILFYYIRRNWKFSKWLAFSTIIQWMSGNIFLFAAGIWLGVSTVGAMKAAQNILGVTHIMFQGIENIVPVQASRKFSLLGLKQMEQYLLRVSIIGLNLTLIIVLVIAMFPTFWLRLFYGEEFMAFSDLLIWYAIIYPIVFLSLTSRIWLRSIEDTRKIFISYVLMTCLGGFTVYPLIHYMEVNGAMLGIFITNIVMLLSLLFGIKESVKRRI